MPTKEVKEDLNNWRDIPCSKIRRLVIVKMSIAPKLTYRFNVTQTGIFVDIEKLIIKFI